MKLIEGVAVKKLKPIPDDRGRVMEILRKDDDIFQQFGQVYLTTAYPGVVKAWHYHKLQTDHFCCISGMMKLVLYDNRNGSPTYGHINEFYLGKHNNAVVVIPPEVYHGFKCVGPAEAMVVNVPTHPYNHQSPDEHRLDPHDSEIPYDWSRKDG